MSSGRWAFGECLLTDGPLSPVSSPRRRFWANYMAGNEQTAGCWLSTYGALSSGGATMMIRKAIHSDSIDPTHTLTCRAAWLLTEHERAAAIADRQIFS